MGSNSEIILYTFHFTLVSGKDFGRESFCTILFSVRILCVEVSQLRKSLRGSEHLPGVCDLSISLMGVDSMDVGGGSLCAKLQGGRNSRGCDLLVSLLGSIGSAHKSIDTE